MSDEPVTAHLDVVFEPGTDFGDIAAVIQAIAQVDGVIEVREPGDVTVRITRRIDK